ncbi:MAG: YfcE family phosphodiesterase [Acidobacteria bacterium]|nr:YfcE family phosphodiesterase [Acidobacteriota bacterium]
MRIGIIADTHGLLRPEAVAALAGVERILHAGDVGSSDVLVALERIAPVDAVRGNVDYGPWADALPLRKDVTLGGVRFHLAHIREDARPGDADVVVFGHSHQPLIEGVDGVLWFNPGSAGPRRFKLPICLGLLEIEGGEARGRLVDLQVP